MLGKCPAGLSKAAIAVGEKADAGLRPACCGGLTADQTLIGHARRRATKTGRLHVGGRGGRLPGRGSAVQAVGLAIERQQLAGDALLNVMALERREAGEFLHLQTVQMDVGHFLVEFAQVALDQNR